MHCRLCLEVDIIKVYFAFVIIALLGWVLGSMCWFGHFP